MLQPKLTSCDLANGEGKMMTKRISVRRWSVISSNPFESVAAALDAAVGHPDIGKFGREIAATKTYAAMQEIVRGTIGSSGFMEFARFDLGAILRKELGPKTPGVCAWSSAIP